MARLNRDFVRLENDFTIIPNEILRNKEMKSSTKNILLTMMNKFDGGPVGLDTLAAAIGEDAGTIEDVYEPYLIKNGFINRTPRGRVITDLAYRHLGLNS